MLIRQLLSPRRIHLGWEALQKQHYRVNIVKQQVTGGGCTALKDMLIQPMEAALNQPKFLTQAQALLGKAISEHTTQRNTEVNE